MVHDRNSNNVNQAKEEDVEVVVGGQNPARHEDGEIREHVNAVCG